MNPFDRVAEVWGAFVEYVWEWSDRFNEWLWHWFFEKEE